MSMTSPPMVVQTNAACSVSSQLTSLNVSMFSGATTHPDHSVIDDRINFGEAPTPDLREPIVNEEYFADGYNSTGCQWHFADGIVGEEREMYSEKAIRVEGNIPEPLKKNAKYTVKKQLE